MAMKMESPGSAPVARGPAVVRVTIVPTKFAIKGLCQDVTTTVFMPSSGRVSVALTTEEASASPVSSAGAISIANSVQSSRGRSLNAVTNLMLKEIVALAYGNSRVSSYSTSKTSPTKLQ
jgi:hypothetical protein